MGPVPARRRAPPGRRLRPRPISALIAARASGRPVTSDEAAARTGRSFSASASPRITANCDRDPPRAAERSCATHPNSSYAPLAKPLAARNRRRSAPSSNGARRSLDSETPHVTTASPPSRAPSAPASSNSFARSSSAGDASHGRRCWHRPPTPSRRSEKASLSNSLADRARPSPPEAQARVAAVMTIEDGWHTNSHEPTFEYLIPTELTVTLPAALAGRRRSPTPPAR